VSAHLLVVEDNADFVENLKEIFGELGHEVRAVATCADARETARDWVQVALVDLKLPDGDGTTLAMQLKADNPDCEVILLTGHASVESAAEAVRAGVWAFLIKPCAVPDLLATLDKAVRHVQAQQEKRELARRAQVAEKLAAVGTLTAGLSHEIRNPLNAAALQLQLLQRRANKVADEALRVKLSEPIELVLVELGRLTTMLDDFLGLARPQEVERDHVELRELVHDVTRLQAPLCATHGIAIEEELEAGLVVLGDRHRLQQVLVNLVVNAREAMLGHALGTRITIVSRREQERAVIEVHDEGPGLKSDAPNDPFTPFVTTKAAGTGLGLAIVRKIARMHGGDVFLENGSRGGAVARLVLPVA